MLYIPAILGLLGTLYLKFSNPKKISAVISGYLDLRAFHRNIREENLVKGLTSNILLLNTVIALSSFVTYLIYKRMGLGQLQDMALIFGVTFGSLISYYWLRKISFFLISFFSESPAVLKELYYYNKVYYQVIGLLILPILFLLNYKISGATDTWLSLLYNGLIYSLELALIISYIVKLIQEFRQTNQLNISGYYLFLYFCTLEILPLIVLLVWFIG